MKVSHANTAGAVDSRAKRAAIGATALVALVIGVWLVSKDDHTAKPAQAEVTELQKPAVWTTAPEAPAKMPSAAPAPSPESNTPVIDSVYLDKTEVCRGEQNFINVEAHTENGTDALLAVLVTNPETGRIERGSRVAFRQTLSSSDPIQITVQGLGTERTVQLPPVTVKDCDDPVQLHVDVERGFAAPDRVAFNARIFEPGGSRAGSFAPYEYVWDFDDGDTVIEATGHVEHSYENRIQSARLSSFVVTVTARERGGRTVAGSRTLTLSNFGYLTREFDDKIDVQVGAKSNPSAGSVADRLWLYHGHDKPVRFSQVHMREIEADGTNGSREIASADYSPQEVLGFSELRPRESRDVVGLNKLAPTRPGAVRFYEIEGRSDDGKLAHATLVLRPPMGPPDVSAPSRQPTESLGEVSDNQAL